MSSVVNQGDSSNQIYLKRRIKQLVKALTEGMYEREEVVKMCLLATLSGESVFLLGPPGIAKSLLAKRLIKIFDDQSYFEYLMTRFSTPEEVFGPLSIQELKDHGKYLRLTKGYLPDAKVVFLDEIWKAGPAILNTLLTVVNEKLFKNGNDTQKVPMRLLICASNELPEPEHGLEALYDRLLVRIFVNRIQNKQNFHAMLTENTGIIDDDIAPELLIQEDEYQCWQSQLMQIPLSDDIFEQLYLLKTFLEKEAIEATQDQNFLYISDRRWKKAVKLLKASAFFNGRSYISPLDILLLQDCLWSSPDERELVFELVEKFAKTNLYSQDKFTQKIHTQLELLQKIKQEIIQTFQVKLAIDSQGTLRKKDIYQIELSKIKRYQVGMKSDLVKLVLLHSYQPVSEHESGKTSWVYVKASDLQECIQKAGGDCYGYINRKTDLRKLTLGVDHQQHLVIKDLANRNIQVGLVESYRSLTDTFTHWYEYIQKQAAQWHIYQQDVKKMRQAFHQDMPHNFLSDKLSLSIETSLQLLNQQIEDLSQSSDALVEKLKLLEDAFEQTVS